MIAAQDDRAVPICGPLDSNRAPLGEPSTPSPPQTILYTDVNISFAMTTQIKPTSRANFDVGVLSTTALAKPWIAF
jgi:hypothetical protein